MIPDDDGSASSDSSSDHSSLHVTSGPIMGGKGPGQLDWMNKFTKNNNNNNTSSSSKQQTLPSNDGPAPAPERRVITRSSSFLRGEIEKPAQPEWMKKFQARNNSNNNDTPPQNGTNGTKERDRSPSPTRETIQNQFLPTAPTTPSWMKQYHKGPVGAGAPMIPSLPSISAGSSLSTTTTTSTATKSERITTKPDKATKPKKDWKALVNKSKAPVEQPPPPPPPVVGEKPLPVAPPTPQWMNKFSGAGKGMPMAPKMDDDEDSEDDKSVSSVSSAISVEPEWMSQFNKVKSGMVIEPKKIKPPSNNKNKAETTDEPEWIQKFQKRSSNTEATVPSPSPKTPGPEPEWMTRFREIGFREDGDEQMSPVRNNNHNKAPVNPSTTSPSSQFNNSSSNRNTLGKSTTTLSTSGSKVVNTPMSRSSFLPPLGSPSTKTGKLSISAKLLTSSNGMLSAPSSPSSSGKLMIRGAGGGGISAPSSPVAGTGSASTVMSAVLTMSPGPPTLVRRGSMESTQPEPKKVDPAAMAPEKPAWMNKVKAVAHSGKDEPEWMLKLKRTKQGITELGPEKGTPPWKIMDRMKAEQHQKLVKEFSISRLDCMHKSEGSMEDHSMNHSKLFDHEDSDNESQDEENIPEWMRQFKKMHLKEAEVLSYAQGRAPQGVSRLRRGSMQMIERSDKYNPAEEPARAIPIILKMPRKMSKRDIFGPTMDDSSSKEFDKSIGNLETTSGKQEEAKTDDNKPQTVQGNAQVAQMQPKASTVVANSLPTGASHGLPGKSAEQALSEDHPTDSKPAPASDAPSRFNNQVEIDNSQPENVMNMWGKKVKSKKPGNATLMSFRMIQNQAELVKERIARAKQKAEAGENAGVDSDEESIKDVETITLSSTGGMDNSAAALFGAAKSGDTTKRTSVGMDNSAAALFGFGGGTVKRESVSMNNSAAALFGFASAHESSNSIGVDNVAERSKSINMDNSAAAMFGFGGAAKSSDNSATGDSSVGMNNSAAALFGVTSGNDDKKATDQSQAKHGESAWAKGKSIAEEDSSDDDSSTEKKKGQGKEEKATVIETKKSLLDDSSSDESSTAGKKKQTQPVVTAKKSFLDDSDSDDASDDDKPRTKVLPKSSNEDSDSDSDDEQPKKVSPKLTKKFSLDDSSSRDSPIKPVFNAKKDDSDNDDSSDDEKPKSKATPAPIQAKKSFLDDSDSDNSDDEKPKTATKVISPTPVKKPLANDSDSDASSNKSKPKQSPPKASPTSVPAKKSFLEDSDSDDSEDNEKVKPKKNAVLFPVKKATPDDSSDSSDDDKAKSKAAASQAAGSKKKSFLDGSDSSDDSVGEERPKLVPMKLSTPAFAQPSTDKKKSSDDDSSSSSSDDDSTAKRKENTMAKIDTEKKIEENKIMPMESNQGWDQTKIKQDNSSPMQNNDDFPTDNNDWDVGPSTDENDQDDEWQAALMELAAEEQAKKEKAEQDAWQAALMELAAEEKAKEEEAQQDAWQAALMQLAAEEELKKKNQNNDDPWDAALREFEEEEKVKEPDKAKATEKVTKPKTKAVDKKKTKDNDVVAATSKVGKKKNKDSDVDNDSNKKSPKTADKETKVKKESKGVDTIAKAKEKNDRVPSKSPKPRKASLVVKESKKKGADASPFDSSPFGASPFGASPFDAIGGQNDPSPFATLGGVAANDSPFAQLDQNSPFGPIGGSNGVSPFAPLDGNDKASKSPFAPLNDGAKTKKATKGLVVKNSSTKKPKSTMKLVVQTTKAKGDLHQKRTKKNGRGKEKADDDDDSFGNMADFDDDFSIKNDFGDFAGEDGSVVPLRAVRNSGSKPTKGTTATTMMFSPKPPLHSSNSKVKPNLLVKQADKVKEKKDSKSTEKEKKDKTRSRSKSKEKRLSRSRSESEAEDKKKSRSRSESVEKLKAHSRSKSPSGRKGRSTSVSKEKKKESGDRSSSLGKGRQSKKKDKK